MRRFSGFPLLIVLLIGFTALAAGCKDKPIETEPPPPEPTFEEPADSKPPITTEPVDETAGFGRDEVSEDDITDKSLQELNDAGHLKDVNFDFDKHEIRADAAEVLAQNAAWLKKYPSVKVLVEGHCDERGTEEYNLALGERRSAAVKSYLVNMGIAADRMQTISFGEELPRDTGHNESAWAKNRRAQFKIIAR